MALHTETAIYKATYQLAQLVMQLVANDFNITKQLAGKVALDKGVRRNGISK